MQLPRFVHRLLPGEAFDTPHGALQKDLVPHQQLEQRLSPRASLANGTPKVLVMVEKRRHGAVAEAVPGTQMLAGPQWAHARRQHQEHPSMWGWLSRRRRLKPCIHRSVTKPLSFGRQHHHTDTTSLRSSHTHHRESATRGAASQCRRARRWTSRCSRRWPPSRSSSSPSRFVGGWGGGWGGLSVWRQSRASSELTFHAWTPRQTRPTQEEARIDAQIKKLEEMDEDDFEVLRRKRLEKLKRQEQQKAEWRLLGHGVCVPRRRDEWMNDRWMSGRPTPPPPYLSTPPFPKPHTPHTQLLGVPEPAGLLRGGQEVPAHGRALLPAHHALLPGGGRALRAARGAAPRDAGA